MRVVPCGNLTPARTPAAAAEESRAPPAPPRGRMRGPPRPADATRRRLGHGGAAGKGHARGELRAVRAAGGVQAALLSWCSGAARARAAAVDEGRRDQAAAFSCRQGERIEERERERELLVERAHEQRAHGADVALVPHEERHALPV